MNSPLERVADLSAWLEAAGLDELELTGSDGHLRLLRGQSALAASDRHEPTQAATGASARSVIFSPMAGVFLAAHPVRAEPLVQPDESVRAGQTVALLRIGAVLAPVTAPQNGVVGAPLAAEGALVGFGEPLIEFWPEEAPI